MAEVPHDSETFEMIQTCHPSFASTIFNPPPSLGSYIRNTHAKTHDAYALDLVDAFEISRSGEAERFGSHSGDERMLLWHGSRLSNFVGILSQGDSFLTESHCQGLRIAPPEAPVTGYMFGKGVYFAGLCSCAAALNGQTWCRSQRIIATHRGIEALGCCSWQRLLWGRVMSFFPQMRTSRKLPRQSCSFVLSNSRGHYLLKAWGKHIRTLQTRSKCFPPKLLT